MQVSVETGEDLQRRMKVVFPAEEIEAELDKRLKKLARTARLSGFRPGKVPLKVLRQRYQDQLQREIIADLIPPAFSDAVSQQALKLAGSPRVEPMLLPDEGQYGFIAAFEVLPEVELSDLAGKSIKRPKVEVTDADVDHVIQRLREQRKTWERVERPAQLGDRVLIDYQGQLDGAAFEGGAGTDATVELGRGGLVPGFEDGLVGVTAGEERTLDLRFPEDHSSEALRGKDVQFVVAVKEVSAAVIPEVDEALARSFGIEDGQVEHLYRDVRENLERERRQRVAARVKSQVIDALLETHPIPVPKSLVRDEINALREQAREGLGAGNKVELPEDLFVESARRRVAIGIILREIVARKGIELDADRVRAQIEELAASYESPQEVIDYYYGDPKRLAPVESKVLEDQVVDWLVTTATVEEDPMSFQELAGVANTAA